MSNFCPFLQPTAELSGQRICLLVWRFNLAHAYRLVGLYPPCAWAHDSPSGEGMISSNRPLAAVIWDFGGVFTTSPFEAFARYEADQGLPSGFLRATNAINPDTNAWARFERAEIDAAAFDRLFAEETAARAGPDGGRAVPGRDVIGLLSGELRPRVVAALKACKAKFKTGCITNNVPAPPGLHFGPGMSRSARDARAVADVFALFDHVIESAKSGLRKPDPRIYALMCEALDVEPGQCVFLDDLGINLKPARAMGMTTIKVISEDQLRADLAVVTGLVLD
jgi:putative hydrolase of the HAD superfamily